ncbi:MAG: hypothetical protein HC780_23605 [Leptolyngbyaceae cyanobacterium CSU_1_3]|nr:hypothetical protein [Leptolyngbyaceae cyanobacterium CSU_1_3]
MVDDPIVEEVRQARQQHAAKFNYDLQAIYQDLKQQEAASGWRIVTFPPRKRRYTPTVTRAKPRVLKSSVEPVLA